MSEPIQHMQSLREAAISLVKFHGIHEGYWALAVEFQLGATVATPNGMMPMPTGMVSVSRVGLQQSVATYPNAVNAAEVNPLDAAQEPAKRRPRQSKQAPEE